MPIDTINVRPPAAPTAGPRAALVMVRRLVITALVSGVGYSWFSTASQSYCPGGTSADGGFVDRHGNPTEVVPSCITLTLRPSPLVYLVLALIVAWAVARAAQNAQEAVAHRVLGRACGIVVITAVLAVVLTVAAFLSISLEGWDETRTPPIPGWLVVDVVITPMQNA